jgi:hypothetical protein
MLRFANSSFCISVSFKKYCENIKQQKFKYEQKVALKKQLYPIKIIDNCYFMLIMLFCPSLFSFQSFYNIMCNWLSF